MHKAKKSLGQNFIKSKLVLKKMCEVSTLTSNDLVIEIGPGKGALTKLLLEKVKKVIAVEKDRDLVEYLKQKFKLEIDKGNLILLEQDILDFDLTDFYRYGLEDKKFKIVANIPYNITGLIIKKFLSNKIQPNLMTLLVQKEVAQRIATSLKKKKSKTVVNENILSLSVKAYGEPSYEMKVNKKLFSPVPKVDSGIILIKNISRKNFNTPEEEKLFFNLIKQGFSHKRKLLKRNLENLVCRDKLKIIFDKLDIDEKIRAENLPLKKWLKIIKILHRSDLCRFKK